MAFLGRSKARAAPQFDAAVAGATEADPTVAGLATTLRRFGPRT
ncbi:MAG: hypothetical protein RIT52_280, partial [Pseudomonadota bacterium]